MSDGVMITAIIVLGLVAMTLINNFFKGDRR